MLSAAEHPLHDSYTQTHAVQPLLFMVGHGRPLMSGAAFVEGLQACR